MYIIQTLNLSDIISFIDKYKSKTPFIKSYEMDSSTDKLTITLQNDAFIVFVTTGTKQYIQWPTGDTAQTSNDTYYVLGFQDKYIFQNAGAFVYGKDLVSGVKNTYLIHGAYCNKCNSQSDLDTSNNNYQLINVILNQSDQYSGANTQMIINLGVFVQYTTIKLDQIAVINAVFYNNITDYSEAAVMSNEGVDLYYLFKLPLLQGYVDGFWRYYALIDEDGYQN